MQSKADRELHPLQVSLTFDHLGGGQDVGLGRQVTPDPTRADLHTAMPRLLGLLDDIAASGTFYVEGWSILHFPAVAQALLAHGHDVGLHGWVHEPWRTLARDQRRRILHDGFAALRNAGVTDPGFRAPGGYLADGDLDELVTLGVAHGSSIVEPLEGRTEPHRHGPHVNVPFLWEGVDYWQYALHPTDLATDDTWIPRWRQLVADARTAGSGTLVLDVHPFFICSDDRRMALLAEFFHELAADPTITFRTVASLAAQWDAANPAPDGIAQVARGASCSPAQATGLPAWTHDQDQPPAPPAEELDHHGDAWVPYLAARGLVTDRTVEASTLSGGVSGRVVAVGDLVVKRAHRRLDVPGDWQSGVSRTLAEALGLRLAARSCADLVPAVVHVDERHRVLVQARVPGAAWKQALLDGVVDEVTVSAVVEALDRVHAIDPGPLDGRRRFATLRLIPYFGRTRGAVPQHAAALDAVMARFAEPGTHVVHGDFSPKNLLVDPHDPGRVTVLDWEVVHRGDPVFDFGFLVTHLVAKAAARPQVAPQLHRAAGLVADRWSGEDRWLAQTTGALLLARCHGSSPLEYLDDEHRSSLTATATALLYEATVPEVIS